MIGCAARGLAQTAPTTPAPPTEPLPVFRVTIVELAPLPGINVPAVELAAPVQTADTAAIRRSGSVDLADLMNRQFASVHVNETQGNPFQPDFNFRGYSASPLLGAPQGLSVYMDGVRLNQPFGEVVSWDLIPRVAIASTTFMPGSNPLFGLNTLGGAVTVQTKDGRSAPGTSLQAIYGSNVRRAVEFEHGGSRASGLHWFLAGNLFGEDGWREASPSTVRQAFGKIGQHRDRGDVALTVSHADNKLTGNGLQELRLLEADRGSFYTKPDETNNRSTFLNLTGSFRPSTRVTWSGNAYFRRIRTNTLNGDINEESLDQSLYQPDADERAALSAAGYTGVPSSGENASNTPFPQWRCIANVLLVDEPSEKCNGLINRSHTRQRTAGLAAQVTFHGADGPRRNQLTLGAGFDASRVDFEQSTELGYLTPDRGVQGLGAFGDGETGGEADGEPFDTRVDLGGRIRTMSAYVSDTLSIGEAWHLTVSGRLNRTSIENRDRILPGGGTGSLDGDHVFVRFNPSAGVTYTASPRVNLYAGYSEGSRAPASIELGCADPESPCKLPNAMAGDPPLEQVVTRTVEAGARSASASRLQWNAGVFFATNANDILFVASEQTGFGYFRNFGETHRHGFEAGLSATVGRVSAGANYTFLSATFQSEELVNGTGNSTNEEAEEGFPGGEGAIEIEPGAEMPGTPRHLGKLFADIRAGDTLSLHVNLVASSGAWARGNENNAHEPDDVYYLGPGRTDAYAVVNLGVRYQVARRVELLAQINNLLDLDYNTVAQLGPTGITPSGTYVARPFPAIGGEFPVTQSTFFGPGAPRTAWVGTRVVF
jgi:outer membrane receptor protein involved in Fe transport